MDHIVVTDEMRDRILTNIDQQTRLMQGTHGSRGHRGTRMTTWMPVVAAAAVLLVICGVTFTANRGGSDASGDLPTAELAQATAAPESAEVRESADSAGTTEAMKDSEGATEAMEDSTTSVDGSAGDSDLAADSSSTMAAGIYWADEYDSAEALSEAVGFEIHDLTSVPIAVTQTSYLTIGEDLAQISYYDAEDNEVCYRKSTGTEDNSGDYNAYGTVEDAAIGDNPLTLEGNDDLVNLAVWTDGQYAYSIQVSNGCSRDEMLTMIGETTSVD